MNDNNTKRERPVGGGHTIIACDRLEEMQSELAALRARLAEAEVISSNARDVLYMVQWAGMIEAEGEDLRICPWCAAPQVDGAHLTGCRLALTMQGIPPDVLSALHTENEKLRKLVRQAFTEGFTTYVGGDKRVCYHAAQSYWSISAARRALGGETSTENNDD